MRKPAVDARQTTVIGDAIYDMQMAVSAGARPVGVSWGYGSADALEAAGAAHVVHHAERTGRPYLMTGDANMRDILGDLDLGDAKPSDPVREVQAGLKKQLPKRFYKEATVQPGDNDTFVIALDGKPVRTPSRQPLGVPYQGLAEAVAAEWQAQQEKIDPATMPLTRLVNTALDGVAAAQEEVFEDILRYAGSDFLCYRADAPEALVARESELWDPYLDWAANMGARMVLSEGIVHVEQPPKQSALLLCCCGATPRRCN